MGNIVFLFAVGNSCFPQMCDPDILALKVAQLRGSEMVAK